MISSLLPRKKKSMYSRALLYTQRTWNTLDECTEEKCWKMLELDDRMLEELIPEFEVSFKERDYDDIRNERKKWVVVRFVSKWNLEIKFVMEKKKKTTETKLVDIASEAVAKMVESKEKVRQLEIPTSLMDEVTNSLRDLNWRTIL